MANAPKVGINGFGRIGRLITRALLENNANGKGPAEVVAVNDLAPPEVLAHLFKYDSVHGHWPDPVEAAGNELRVNGTTIQVLSEKDPANLPWKDLGVDYVIESTGRFTDRDGMTKHVDAGAKRVLLSAPGKGVDVTLVRGVNMEMYQPDEHQLISNASCTTNCLAPVLKVLDDAFGVEDAVMTTIHAYTNDQRLLDSAHKDLRRARAAGVSMIPTTTGAARAIGQVMPHLKGKVDGLAVRVPMANGSLVDVNATLRERVEKDRVDDAFRQAAQNGLSGILAAEDKPLVSIDFIHDPHSAVVDLPGSMVVDHGSLVKVLAWYDNEWAYSVRMAELVNDVWRLDAGHAREDVLTAGRARGRA